MKEIIHLSQPFSVSMADSWFEVANLKHFWIRRRFEVFKSLAPTLMNTNQPIAEIGCGNGLLQRQIELAFGKSVDGFDLNESALRQNVSKLSSIYYYNIHDRRSELKNRYGIIFMFDIIEHIEDENSFIESVQFHLQPEGAIVINVPAFMTLYSNYDRAAGHLRRYEIADLERLVKQCELKIKNWSYWGLPLYLSLLVRKRFLKKGTENEIIYLGFDPRNDIINRLLLIYSKMERIPQKLLGTSIMAVLRNS